MKEITYGKSMYGGWYCECRKDTWEDGESPVDYFHTDTLKELKQIAKENNVILKFRFDNI